MARASRRTSKKKASRRPSPGPGLDQARAATASKSLLGPLQTLSLDIREQFREGLRRRGHTTRPVHFQAVANLPQAGARLTSLASRAGISKQAMGKLVEELEGIGYVERVPDPADGRARLVRFTKSGIALMRDSLVVIDEIWNEYEAILGPKKLVALRDSLAKLNHGISSHRAHNLAMKLELED